MRNSENTRIAFLELVKAGLWGNGNPDIRIDGTTDWQEVYRLATEQSVIGLVLAGLEHSDVKPPQVLLLQWIGEVQMIEQRNKAMNAFVAETILALREQNIYALLVKGQGIAQCYEKPLWRPSGDIDFFLSKDNYGKAVVFFKNKYSNNKDGGQYSQEYAFYTDQWMIEVHGSLRTCLSSRIDKVVDTVQKSVFYGGNVRSWDNNGTLVFLPAPTEDVFLVFTHFIKHFYKEGMSLRQVCDWCRLLWTFKDSLSHGKLELWINKAGLMKEWKAFYNLASRYLGMPDLGLRLTGVESATSRHSSNKFGSAHDSIADFMVCDSRYDKKAEKLMEFILGGYSGNKIKDTLQIAKIFPWKTLRYSPSVFLNLNWLKVRERLFK